jgi:hypothetical protein
VKSGCRIHLKNQTARWSFIIRKNKVANYFLFLAFDNRESLNPEHIWLVPGYIVNDKTTISIADLPKTLIKWSKYERSLNNVLKCCDKLKEG